MAERGVVRISPDVDRLMSTAAELFVTVVQEAIAARGRADIALTGGSTPRPLYQLLATPSYAGRIDWTRTQIWFGDDRCVGPDDERSNFGMARDALLSHVPLPTGNIHRMRGELPPEEGAAQYAAELQASFQLASGTFPRLDLIWLGVGPDGHVASLFPGSPGLQVRDKIVTANPHDGFPPPPVARITFTMPTLNAAARVAFLIAGQDKAPLVARIIEDNGGDHPLPAQMVAPPNGELLWLLDLAAAGDLHA